MSQRAAEHLRSSELHLEHRRGLLLYRCHCCMVHGTNTRHRFLGFKEEFQQIFGRSLAGKLDEGTPQGHVNGSPGHQRVSNLAESWPVLKNTTAMQLLLALRLAIQRHAVRCKIIWYRLIASSSFKRKPTVSFINIQVWNVFQDLLLGWSEKTMLTATSSLA